MRDLIEGESLIKDISILRLCSNQAELGILHGQQGLEKIPSKLHVYGFKIAEKLWKWV